MINYLPALHKKYVANHKIGTYHTAVTHHSNTASTHPLVTFHHHTPQPRTHETQCGDKLQNQSNFIIIT